MKEKDLKWFIENYPNKEERYWKISDYLTDYIKHWEQTGKKNINELIKQELLLFIDEYTKEKTRRSTLQIALTMDINVRENKN